MKNLANKSLPPSAVFQLEMVGFGTFFFLNIWMGSYYIYTYLNQNVSHNILNALVVLAHIRSFLTSLLPLQSLHVVYLNFTVSNCIYLTE